MNEANHNEESKEADNSGKQAIDTGAGIALGAGIGAALGVAMGNIGLWLAIGVAIGAALGSAKFVSQAKSKS